MKMHHQWLLVLRVGLVGRPRAEKASLYQRSFFMTVGISSFRTYRVCLRHAR